MPILKFGCEDECIEVVRQFPGLYANAFIQQVIYSSHFTFTEDQVRDEIWRMLSDNKLKFTPERTIVPGPTLKMYLLLTRRRSDGDCYFEDETKGEG